jgi:hypothetical protein
VRQGMNGQWKKRFYLTQDRLSFLCPDNQKVQVWSLAFPPPSAGTGFLYRSVTVSMLYFLVAADCDAAWFSDSYAESCPNIFFLLALRM